MKCSNDCPYLYMYTGKCELNQVDEWEMCPSPKKRQELKEIGERWKRDKVGVDGNVRV